MVTHDDLRTVDKPVIDRSYPRWNGDANHPLLRWNGDAFAL